MPLKSITTSRNHEFEIMIFVASLVSGVSFFLGKPPQSLEQSMPQWFLIYWYASLVAGGVFGLLSTLLKRKTRQQLWVVLHLEGAALMIISGALFGYISVILSTVGVKGIVPSVLITGWLAACAVRIFRVFVSTQRLRKIDEVEKREEDTV